MAKAHGHRWDRKREASLAAGHPLGTLSHYSSLRFAMLQIDQVAATAAKNTVAMPIHIAPATKARNRWSLEMRSKRGGAGGSGALCTG